MKPSPKISRLVRHRLLLRVAKSTPSAGHAARIIRFTANVREEASKPFHGVDLNSLQEED